MAPDGVAVQKGRCRGILSVALLALLVTAASCTIGAASPDSPLSVAEKRASVPVGKGDLDPLVPSPGTDAFPLSEKNHRRASKLFVEEFINSDDSISSSNSNSAAAANSSDSSADDSNNNSSSSDSDSGAGGHSGVVSMLPTAVAAGIVLILVAVSIVSGRLCGQYCGRGRTAADAEEGGGYDDVADVENGGDDDERGPLLQHDTSPPPRPHGAHSSTSPSARRGRDSSHSRRQGRSGASSAAASEVRWPSLSRRWRSLLFGRRDDEEEEEEDGDGDYAGEGGGNVGPFAVVEVTPMAAEPQTPPPARDGGREGGSNGNGAAVDDEEEDGWAAARSDSRPALTPKVADAHTSAVAMMDGLCAEVLDADPIAEEERHEQQRLGVFPSPEKAQTDRDSLPPMRRDVGRPPLPHSRRRETPSTVAAAAEFMNFRAVSLGNTAAATGDGGNDGEEPLQPTAASPSPRTPEVDTTGAAAADGDFAASAVTPSPSEAPTQDDASGSEGSRRRRRSSRRRRQSEYYEPCQPVLSLTPSTSMSVGDGCSEGSSGWPDGAATSEPTPTTGNLETGEGEAEEGDWRGAAEEAAGTQPPSETGSSPAGRSAPLPPTVDGDAPRAPLTGPVSSSAELDRVQTVNDCFALDDDLALLDASEEPATDSGYGGAGYSPAGAFTGGSDGDQGQQPQEEQPCPPNCIDSQEAYVCPAAFALDDGLSPYPTPVVTDGASGAGCGGGGAVPVYLSTPAGMENPHHHHHMAMHALDDDLSLMVGDVATDGPVTGTTPVVVFSGSTTASNSYASRSSLSAATPLNPAAITRSATPTIARQGSSAASSTYFPVSSTSSPPVPLSPLRSRNGSITAPPQTEAQQVVSTSYYYEGQVVLPPLAYTYTHGGLRDAAPAAEQKVPRLNRGELAAGSTDSSTTSDSNSVRGDGSTVKGSSTTTSPLRISVAAKSVNGDDDQEDEDDAPQWLSTSVGGVPVRMSVREHETLLRNKKWLFPMIDGAEEL